jgi:tRNA/rRNA methyltransferase
MASGASGSGGLAVAKSAGGENAAASANFTCPMPPSADPTRFVLMRTSHGGNVGAAARAMKVMGFSDLVLVQPRFADVLVREDTLAMASGATDILARARSVATLDEALDGIHHACATAMTPRDFGPPTHAPRDHFQALKGSVMRVAFVFGSERFGMSNDEVYRCQACLSIPTDARYGSLNLAQAVQLIAYEWRMALGGFAVEPRTPDATLADMVAVKGAVDHWARALVQIGFLDPAAPKKLMPRLQQLLNRAQLTQDEVHILRGIARAIEQRR